MKQLVVVLLISSLAACSGLPTKYMRETPVVWSDDETEFALVTLEEAQAGQTRDSRVQHRIIAQSVSGLERRGLTGLRPYQPGRIFYMLSRGYLIVESIMDNGHIKIDRIAVQGGHEIPIIETRGPVSPCGGDKDGAYLQTQVIPAPDARVLAFGHSDNCGEATIEFLDARSLRVLDTQTTAIPGKAVLTWHPDGHLILATLDGKQAWQLAPDQVILPAEYPRCLFPQTTSSPYSSTGKYASIVDDNKVEISDDAASTKAFGCQ